MRVFIQKTNKYTHGYIYSARKEEGGDLVVNKERLIAASIATFCLTVAVFSAIPVLSVQPYDPWRDLNDDGVIDVKDFQIMKNAIPSLGTPLTKAYLAYDSDWINIIDEAGQYIDLTHNLNSTDVIVDITGKTTLDGGTHQRYLGGANAVAGSAFGWAYGGTGFERANSVVQSDDGGYAFGGVTFSFGAGSGDFWFVKVDGNGNEQWNMTYGGTGEDYALSVVQTTDDGYALAGYTDSYGADSRDFWLVKTDASGQMTLTDSFEYGLAWVDSSANVITLYRGTKDTYWNFVRVRLWKIK
jgi:hypothetical protein